MPTQTEVHRTIPHFEEKLDEIRALCRAHNYATGRWENLADLPPRLSRDSSLRSDLSAIVRSLQGRHLHLPDVLDLLVIAVGGSAAPDHMRQLASQINLLGGFLASIGRWPDVNAEPILAPGEVPPDIEKFTHPQPASAPPTRSTMELPEVSSPAPNAPAETDGSAGDVAGLTGDEAEAMDADAPPELEPPPAPAAAANEALLADIARALARLERGSLEMRDHLESIDQRISRMEPLLETGRAAPVQTAPAEFDPPAWATDLPEQAPLRPRDPRTPRAAFQGNSFRADSGYGEPFRSEPTQRQPAQTQPGRTEPSRALPARTALTWTQQISNPQISSPQIPTPAPEPSPRHEAKPRRVLEEPSVSPASFDRPSASPSRSFDATTTWSPASSGAAISRPPADVVPRFSRFARDVEPIAPAPAANRTGSHPEARLVAAEVSTQAPAVAAARSDLEPAIAGPTLPAAKDVEVGHEDLRAAGSRRFALIASILVVLGLVAAGFLYFRSISGSGEHSPNASITSSAAPRPAGTDASSGPLSMTPAGSSRANGNSGVPPNTGAGSRTGANSGFRPAGLFVSAAVMEGRLLSAPLPRDSRVPAGSGLKGLVVLEANIAKTGQVEDLRVLGGNPNLRSAAIDAVRNWRYKPYLVNGAPVEVRTVIRVDFNQHTPQPATRSAPFPA